MFIYLSLLLTEFSCVDPECFVREYSPTLDLLFLVRGEEKRVIIYPPAKRCWWLAQHCILALRFLQGILTSIAKKSYSYVIFQGGGSWSPVPLSGSTHDIFDNSHRRSITIRWNLIDSSLVVWTFQIDKIVWLWYLVDHAAILKSFKHYFFNICWTV